MENRPNLYELSSGNTRITFSTTSFSGARQLTYTSGRTTLSFQGEDIHIMDSPVGTLVSVDLEYAPDLRTVSLTLVVPQVNLRGNAVEAHVHTIAILTTHRTSIGGPGLIVGQVETYRTLRPRGLARLVDF
jgi:hypothetical protein